MRCQHKERFGQQVVGTGNGDFAFLHGLEKGGLGFGWRAIDLIGQKDVGKDRALDEAKGSLAGGRVFLQHLGAGDV